MESISWKCVAILSCLLALTLAKEPQLKLEDIERDTLSNEKQFQQQSNLPSTIQQLPPRQYFAVPTQPPQPAPQIPQGPPQASTGPHQFSPDARQFPPPPPLKLQFPSSAPQQQVVQVPVIVHQGADDPFQFQYIPDNSLNSNFFNNFFGSSNSPKYVYVQQPNNPIPVNNKQGGIEYVQYLDSNTGILNNPKTQAALNNLHHKATHNLAGLIQRTAYTNVLPVNYRQPAPQTYRVQGQPKPLVNQNIYVVPPAQPLQQPVNSPIHFQQNNNQILAQQRFLIPQPPTPPPQYLQQQQQQYQQQQYQFPGFGQQQAQQSITNVVYEKREPQSLLDSYVPSVLQVQYYKELERQQQANAVTGKLVNRQQTGKLLGGDGKSS